MGRVLYVTALVLLTSSLVWSAEAKEVAAESKEEGETSIVSELMNVMTECNETFRIDMSYIEALNESGSFPDETDKTPKCYVRCVLEKMGVASPEGEYDPARAAEVFQNEREDRPASEIQEVAAGCIGTQEKCKCERAYQFLKCLMEAEIKKYSSTPAD